MSALASYLNNLLHSHGWTVQDVVSHCNLERSYGYQLFNGTRRPTRNFLLRLPEAETQRLLKIAGRQTLYVRNRRDAAVLYGLPHSQTDSRTDLYALGMTLIWLLTGRYDWAALQRRTVFLAG